MGDEDRAAALVEGALVPGVEGDPYVILLDPIFARIRNRPGIDRLLPVGSRPPV